MDENGPTGAEASSNGRPSTLDAAPGMIRIAATAWLRTASWTVDSAVSTGRWLGRAAISGESPAKVLEQAGTELRGSLRRLLGIDSPPPDEDIARAAREPGSSPAKTGPDDEIGSELRQRGASLLRRSAGVGTEDGAHPAYSRILDAIAPDEARVLRLLVEQGPQAAVDVRTWRPLGIGSELVAPGLSMLGAEAGCRQPEKIPMYLNNLFRLGLIWFSREPIPDTGRYQVLEAQPATLAAMKKAGRGTTVRRSIRLTPFGEDFCETVLPLDTAEFQAVGIEDRDPPETPGMKEESGLGRGLMP